MYKNLLIDTCKIIYKILILPESDWKTKIYGNTFMAYLVNPDDITPDHEENGFIDDLYLGLLILKDLYKYRPELIKKASINSFDVISTIEKNLEDIKAIVRNKTKAIEEYSGYSSLKYFDLPNNRSNLKTLNHLKIKAKLLGSIAYFFKNLTETNTDVRNHLHFPVMCILKSIKETGEYFEINRIISYEAHKKISDDKIKTIDLLEDVFFDYEKYLSNIKESNNNSELLKYLPLIFKTLCHIYKSPKCPWEVRHEINSALAYLAIFEDIIDDKEENGMLDDLFIMGFVLMDIYESNKTMVHQNLEDISIQELIEILEKTGMLNDDRLGEILNYLGLRGLLEFFDIRSKTNNHYLNEEMNILILQNNRLKRMLLELARLSLGHSFRIDGKKSAVNIIEHIKNELNEDESKEIENFIKLSEELAYVENINEVFNKQDEEEIKLLLLKHEILGSL
jgi:uncharacterized membrane protein YkvA (DUF1232 family)